jgi:hypothetical protein
MKRSEAWSADRARLKVAPQQPPLTSGVANMISTLYRRSTLRMVAVWPCRSALAQAPVPVELLRVGPKKPIDQCRRPAGRDRSKDADVYFWIQRLTERLLPDYVCDRHPER